MTTDELAIDSWRSLPAAQQPAWPDADALRAVVGRPAARRRSSFAGEVDQLRDRLAAVARGEAFLLQGGDCAETFAAPARGRHRAARCGTLLQMAVVLTYGASMPVVKLGRIAGQYAKPRSSDTETPAALTVRLPRRHGQRRFTAESRTPDPRRILRAYNTAAVDAEPVARYAGGGFAALDQVHAWNTDVRPHDRDRRALREAGRRDRPGGAVHAGLRRARRGSGRRRALRRARGADAGLRDAR